jgi:hypothetical protein
VRCLSDDYQEETMRSILRIGVVALALCAGAGLAAGQNNQATGQGQPARQDDRPAVSDPNTIPPPGAPSQPDNPLGDLAKPSAVAPQEGTATDNIAEQVPGATPQTVPSTMSAENAAIDQRPIVSMQLPLTEEQKQKIGASLAKASVAPVGGIAATVTQSLPTGVLLQEFPDEATAAVPEVGRYKYVKLPDRVLIVDPPFWTVVGEIKK